MNFWLKNVYQEHTQSILKGYIDIICCLNTVKAQFTYLKENIINGTRDNLADLLSCVHIQLES